METPNVSDQKPKRVVAPLNPSRRQPTEQVNNDHTIFVDSGVSLEDLRTPDYWAHIAVHLTQHDTIRVIPDDGTWYAWLVVIQCDKNSAHIEVLQFIDLDPAVTNVGDGPAIPNTHEVKWRGRHQKWCVIRRVDGALLRTGLKRDEAVEWLVNYLKAAPSKVAA